MELDTVEPPFGTVFPAPSVAANIDAAVGGCVTVQVKRAGVSSVFPIISTALTVNVCCVPAAKLL
jgi:hypothetical protein